MTTEERLEIEDTLARLEKKMRERLANKRTEATLKKLAETQAHSDKRFKTLFEIQRRNDKS